MSTKKNIFYSATDIILQTLINLVVGIILARLLGAEIIGIVGIISALQGVLFILVESGLHYYIINNKNVNNADLNTVFFTNLFFSITLFLLFWFLAPLISTFYQRDITLVIRTVLINLIFYAPTVVYRALLVKKFEFNRIAISSFIAVFISGTVAVLSAFQGFGIWSFIIRILLGQIITLLLFVYFSRWLPSVIFSFDRLKKMYSYSSKLLFADLLNKPLSGIYVLFIGKVFSIELLGFYTRANQFKEIGVNVISNSLKMVGFSEFSAITCKEKQQDKLIYFENLTILISVLVSTFIFFNADIIINILLGNEWNKSIYFLRVLAVMIAFVPIYNLNLSFLAATGNAKFVLLVESLSKIFTIIVMVFGCFVTIDVMVILVVLASVCNYMLATYFLNKSSIKVKPQIQQVFISLLLFFILFVLHNYSGINWDKIGIINSLICKVVTFLVVFSIYMVILYKPFLMIAMNKIKNIGKQS